jgi:hypothetical protein
MNKTWASAFCFIILMSTAVNVFAAPVPDTGQTTCYNVTGGVINCPLPGMALYGQDANYTPSTRPPTLSWMAAAMRCRVRLRPGLW